jgi:hypothetical protein
MKCPFCGSGERWIVWIEDYRYACTECGEKFIHDECESDDY